MGKNSGISWTDHTFNPWWGCTKISPACENCYAETLAKRFGFQWGPTAPRRFFGDSHWNEPLRWNREAERAGKPAKVFCGSMCDLFEDRPDLEDARAKVWSLIERTPSLIWLLLTKRPENFRAMLPTIQIGGEELRRFDNVWLGVTVENQATADTRIPLLLQTTADRHFLSVEPLLEGVKLAKCWICEGPGVEGCNCEQGIDGPIDWVIVGGESGPHARPCSVEWIRSVVQQCKGAGVSAFVKQLGANPVVAGSRLRHWEWGGAIGRDAKFAELHPGSDDWRVCLKDRAGADPSEWPEDLRVRQMPEVR